MKTQPRFGSTSLRLEKTAHASMGNPRVLQNTLSFTLQAWVNPENLHGTQTIISKHSNNTTGAFLLFLEDGIPTAYYRKAPYFLKAKDAITAKEWHHITATYDAGENTLTLYVDGVQKAQERFEFEPVTSSPDDILIGADGGATPKNFFQGLIGRVEIWSSCRTLDQIAKDSVMVADPTAEPFLEAHFDFTVLPAMDQSGNDLSISLKNGADYCLDVPGVKLANNAYINCGNNLDLSFEGTDPYTIEGWIYPNELSGTIVSKFNPDSEGEYAVTLKDGKLCSYRNSPHTFIDSDAIFKKDYSYYHIAIVYNNVDKTLSVYINGNLQASKYFYENVLQDPNIDFLIGAMLNNGSPGNFFTGYIQNMRVWKKALNTGEIQQWMLNQPVKDPHLQASFDFTVNPPVDTTGKNDIKLMNGAKHEARKIILEPADIITKIGDFQSINGAYLNSEDVTADPPPAYASKPIPTDAVFEAFSDEFFTTIQNELEGIMNKNKYTENRRNDHRTKFEESYAKAKEMMEENPELKKAFTTVRSQGIVQLIHHGVDGDEIIFEGSSEENSDCVIWWISFIYKLTVGFFQAIGLIPSTGNIAKRIYNLIIANKAVVKVLTSMVGKAISVAAGVGLMRVIYEQGLIWPILKFVFVSAGWWALFWVLKKVIAIVTGLEAAEILAGFVVWAGQLTILSLQFPTACASKQTIQIQPN